MSSKAASKLENRKVQEQSVVKLEKAATKSQASRVVPLPVVVEEDSDSEFSSQSTKEEETLGAEQRASLTESFTFPSFVVAPKKSSSIYTLVANRNKNAYLQSGYLLAARSFLTRPGKRSCCDDGDDFPAKIGRYQASYKRMLVLESGAEQSIFNPDDMTEFLKVLDEKDDAERALLAKNTKKVVAEAQTAVAAASAVLEL